MRCLYKPAICIAVCFLFAACETPEERTLKNRVTKSRHHHTVQIQGMLFSPSVVEVYPGDTITWINRDMFEHNVTEELNKDWASPGLPYGASWNLVAVKSSDYYCTLHPSMKGSITVR